jgi:hypothetical protein
MGMADRDHRDEPVPAEPADGDDGAAPWWRGTDHEPEPDWAEGIREGRRARGDQLRDVFEGFDDVVDEEGDVTGSVLPRKVKRQPRSPQERHE